ncbi:IclR family transcriptional regulator [Rhizobium sp. ARZ01]|uniref:IclR family transcriptional regulator n=1 Tax=Rhizobium sp. ARZ01 TaxID=2769313 RepID=UPI0017855673|nr:IclR family transcriptional regulator [Rhizobium sp. ARZ01]MBD9371227.1 IclR family transcriptional regulator [Rhizobium sp. ARZ01]
MAGQSETDLPVSNTGTLGKAIAVLELVALADRPLRFTEILERVGQPRGTLHRQLSHLVEEGLLDLKADHCYEPGLRLLKLASNAWMRSDLRRLAAPHLQTLHELTGETVHLGVLKGAEIIYLDKVESKQAVRMTSQIGKASPAYCTGVGKAALSVLPEARLRDLLRAVSFQRFTPHTITTCEALGAELAVIREVGYAFDREEHEPGIRCVAAAIADSAQTFVGGVSVTGPAYRVGEEVLETWAPLVRKTAATIMEEIAARLGPHR